MDKADTDLCSDYLLSAFVALTATGLSAVVEEETSHDLVTGFFIRERPHFNVAVEASEARGSFD